MRCENKRKRRDVENTTKGEREKKRNGRERRKPPNSHNSSTIEMITSSLSADG
jgi:hypothetical protein